MKLEDILTLVKAGYTREEIDKLETPEAPAGHTAPPSETPDTPKPAEAPTPPAKAPEETPKPAAAPETTSNDQVLGAINALTAAIQKMNVQNASIPGGGEELTAEDMIANIINPPMKPKGGK